MTFTAENDNTEPKADETPAADETIAAQVEDGATAADTPPADEFVEVLIEGESPPPEEDDSKAPEWVREVRKTNRAQAQKIRELEQKLQGSAPAVPELGPKPTLESCDYDEGKFEQQLDAWKERKRGAEAAQAEQRKANEAAQADWQTRLTAYGEAKKGLKVSDFDDAEAAATESLSQTQQAILVKGAENPALLVYALGKNPKMAKELSSITDPVQFAFAAARLETKLKVTPRKTAPLPETTVRGSAPVAGAVDSTLARLEAEADKTGDRTKVIAYKRQQRQKAA